MRLLYPALLLACLLPVAAHAQDPAHVPTADPVVLRVETGSVMVSQQGAEFVTVDTDASLQPDDRVLVPEGSVASLDYGDGCVVGLVTGTAPVATSCPVAAAATTPAPGVPVASTATGPSTALIVGGVAGVVAIAAIAGGGSSSSDTPPVSR